MIASRLRNSLEPCRYSIGFVFLTHKRCCKQKCVSQFESVNWSVMVFVFMFVLEFVFMFVLEFVFVFVFVFVCVCVCVVV